MRLKEKKSPVNDCVNGLQSKFENFSIKWDWPTFLYCDNDKG